jgi:hypothetical protein
MMKLVCKIFIGRPTGTTKYFAMMKKLNKSRSSASYCHKLKNWCTELSAALAKGIKLIDAEIKQESKGLFQEVSTFKGTILLPLGQDGFLHYEEPLFTWPMNHNWMI